MRGPIKYCMILLVGLMFSQTVLGQDKAVLGDKLTKSTKSKVISHTFEAPSAGAYTVTIYGPGGEEVTRPMQNQQLKAGSREVVQFNIKYWSPGSYQLVVKSGPKRINSKRFVIRSK